MLTECMPAILNVILSAYSEISKKTGIYSCPKMKTNSNVALDAIKYQASKKASQ